MPLTTTAINSLKPQSKDKFYADDHGLYLRVATSGAKTFLFRTRVGGKARWSVLGVYPSLGLADARKRCLELDGTTLPSLQTVQAAYDDWITAIRRTYKDPAQVEGRMGKHFLPKFGKRALAQVTRAEIVTQLKAVAAESPVQANRLLANVKLFYSHCVESGWLPSSIMADVTRKVAGGKEKSRDRVLTDEELVELMGILLYNRSASKATYFDPLTRCALAWALMTGQRSTEIRAVSRPMVAGRIWAIPVDLTKTERPMLVYLPHPFSKFISQVFKLHGDTPFEGMERQTLAHATRYMKFDPGFTPHDLRRTMRTRMADMGVMPHIGEKCLNHKLDGVWAIYDRAEYADEKADAWRKWARYLIKAAKSARKKAPK